MVPHKSIQGKSTFCEHSTPVYGKEFVQQSILPKKNINDQAQSQSPHSWQQISYSLFHNHNYSHNYDHCQDCESILFLNKEEVIP